TSDQGFWVAGERTPESEIASLVAINQSGTYQGGAIGVKVENVLNSSGVSSVVTSTVAGTSAVNVNFGAHTVDGSITFDRSLPFSGTLNSDGTFSASGSNVVNGALYGPHAEAVGGNFKYTDSTNPSYYGIFGGIR
ncbi:MAG: hypothetical protein M0017_03060, partial [Desulfobacteraceae bacterium]|nr:hypothetical protein [Desulfobacteraceae bacterium]